ncbi:MULTISPECIES: ATP-binding protein [Streptomyces]|uniref:ATP-binding protein n=1 Tax=Streptomyces TaxID=1883 RepID=UPI000A5D0BCB|nr:MULTISPECIES: ATP-binding protein [Streptomyces]
MNTQHRPVTVTTPASPASPASPAFPASPASGSFPPARGLTVQLSSTRRGARLARRFVAQHLADWGFPFDGGLSSTAALITAELAANAVRHCGGTGRDFRVHVLLPPPPEPLRIEVTDACADRPLPAGPPSPAPDGGSGNGLLLVDTLAARWGCTVNDAITKTVWAELYR